MCASRRQLSTFAPRGEALTVQEQGARIIMGRNALKKRKSITNAVRRGRRQLGWIEEGVDRDDLLEQGGHDAERVPQYEGEFWDLLALLAQFQQSSLSGVLVEEVGNVCQRPAIILRYGAFALDVVLGVVRIDTVAVGRKAVVVALVSSICRGGSSSLSVLLMRMLLLLLLLLLLLHPGRVSMAICMAIEVWVGHHRVG